MNSTFDSAAGFGTLSSSGIAVRVAGALQATAQVLIRAASALRTTASRFEHRRREREELRAALRRERYFDWELRARENFLRRSRDLHDFELRQQRWERGELGDYRLGGW
jgi:hypothetical protein